MHRISMILIALASTAAAKPTGWTAQQRSCPANQTAENLPDELVKSMLPGATEENISDETAEQLANLALGCAKQTKVAKARLEPYIEFATWQLTSIGLGRQVKARGIDPQQLASAMNVGPGRANPSFEKLSDDQVTQLMVALKARGIEVETLGEDVWQLVGGYLEATSRASRAR